MSPLRYLSNNNTACKRPGCTQGTDWQQISTPIWCFLRQSFARCLFSAICPDQERDQIFKKWAYSLHSLLRHSGQVWWFQVSESFSLRPWDENMTSAIAKGYDSYDFQQCLVTCPKKYEGSSGSFGPCTFWGHNCRKIAWTVQSCPHLIKFPKFTALKCGNQSASLCRWQFHCPQKIVCSDRPAELLNFASAGRGEVQPYWSGVTNSPGPK